jgi:protein phosphatase 1L
MLSSRSVYTGKRTSHVSPLSPINANLKERTRRVCVNSFKELDAISVQGTSRKQNEDRYLVEDGTDAGYQTIAAVFDGHGGNATAEWLKVNFSKYVAKFWQETYSPEAAMTEAFLAADRRILTPKKGFMGMVGERGIGGSKCGATGAVAITYQDENGMPYIMAANAGDARVVLGGKDGVIQMTVDHVPDSEDERKRIENQNPNPNMPLVRYIGGTWRVGGLLALSRAFGDAYMKGTGQFEGIQAGSDNYSSGFGVIADPDIRVKMLGKNDSWLIVASDGLFENEVRGGGGGLTNEQAIKICEKNKSKSCRDIAAILVDAAVEAGTTDDVTVIVGKL